MALTEKHRSSIYQYLAPRWGDDVTEAFLSEFPARGQDEPITKDFLRAELTREIATVRTDLTKEIAQLRTDMAALGSRLAGLVIGAAAVLAALMGIAVTVALTLA